MSLKEDVLRLKKEKNAIILAHYYVDGAVQDVADFVGDSYALAKKAKNTDADIIVFAGVKFMGESAKMLNPEKKVLMPDLNADCPMAHMASKAVIKKMKEEYEDLAVVCYINSTAELKTMADICVTSSNAVKIVRSLPNKNIFFIPDGNLGAYVKKQVPEKNIILNDGYCITHKRVTLKDVEKARKEHPNVPIIVHPECVNEVVEATDFAGSTSELIQYTVDNPNKEFVIGTELGVLHEPGQGEHQNGRKGQHDNILLEKLESTHIEAAGGEELRERDRLRAPDDLRDGTQHKRCAKSTDHRHNAVCITNGTVHCALNGHTDQGSQQTGGQNGQRERERHVNERKRNKGTKNIQVAVCEVDLIQQAVNHAVTDGDHRIHGAERNAVTGCL